MAAAGGREGSPLSRDLLREAYRFDFFQAVRLLERLQAERADAGEPVPHHPVGQDRSPEAEAVRFRAVPSLSFPAGDVASVRKPPAREGLPEPPLEMLVAFMGLTGPNGALPQHYTTLLMQRAKLKDASLRDWLDLFNHRLVSHFYRAWEKYRLPFAFERARLDPSGPREDLATRGLYSLVGMGTAGLRDRQEFPDAALLYYSGHFAHEPRSAQGLEALLAEHFGVPVAVQQFAGQWLYLDAENRAILPSGGLGGAPCTQVGVDAVIGRRVWDAQSKFRLKLGPLEYEEFRRFLPGGESLRPLNDVTRLYVGAELDFDVQPVLKPAAVPWAQLNYDEADGPHLGWNVWVRTHGFGTDVGDAVFAAEG